MLVGHGCSHVLGARDIGKFLMTLLPLKRMILARMLLAKMAPMTPFQRSAFLDMCVLQLVEGPGFEKKKGIAERVPEERG